jgi:hypothetical protein
MLIPVYLSVSLIIGHFADLIGSIEEHVPYRSNSEVSLLINVCSLTAGM